MEGKEIIYEFLDYISYEKKYSDNTEKNYELDLFKYFEYLDKNNLNYLTVKYKDVSNFTLFLAKQNYKSTTINRIDSSIRSFYNYLELEEKINGNPFKAASNLKVPKRLPNYFKYDEYLTMISVIDKDDYEYRNRLILEMLFATGLRVSELSNIKIKDIDFSEREIKIMGKGSKERFVFYNKECAIVLDSYLKECRSKLLNGKDSEYLFINHLGDKLTDRGIRLIIDKIVKKSCIKSKVSPHTFRHTFATMLLNEGCNIKSVQELLGHSSLGTTGIYTHLTNDEVRLAYMKAHPRA
ncbi:MAG: tyrosine-type recombinase/integrase [Tenericutes bacterium]|nr:tyrosine-type recombinase/integrase [Mycoplasmatota bacterium]